MKSSFEQNSGTYRKVGDYRIPNITLPAEANKPLGVWGLKHRDYLMQHKRVRFNGTACITPTMVIAS